LDGPEEIRKELFMARATPGNDERLEADAAGVLVFPSVKKPASGVRSQEFSQEVT
jgi:hypothetical protein